MRGETRSDPAVYGSLAALLLIGSGCSGGATGRATMIAEQRAPVAAHLAERTGSSSWRAFAGTSPWNTPIAANPAVDASSPTMISDFSTISGQTHFWINIQAYSVPVYWVDSELVPRVKVAAMLGSSGFRTGASSDLAGAGSGFAPIPAGVIAASGEDRHLAIVDRSRNVEWGFWNAVPNGASWTAGEASTTDLSGDGVRPPERNAPWWAGHGPRACGFSLIAGLITVDDIRSQSIEHALVVAYPHIRSRFYTTPASTGQATTNEALPTRGVPCGGRIQLDPGVDLSALGLSTAGLAIARALQKYGAFVGDYAGAVALFADASPEARGYWNEGGLTNDDAQRIPLDRFRVLAIGKVYDNMN